MKVEVLVDKDALAETASNFLLGEIRKHAKLLLCAATGNTPIGTYKKLSEKLKSDQAEKIRLLKLDEWGGISMAHPESCEQYLQESLIKPLNISKDRYFSFESDPNNPELEIKRMQKILDREGPIDLCVLGLGANGHLAFNEPADPLIPHCHIADLSSASMQHSMAQAMEEKPTYGLSLGMADILQSKTIVILISGKHKRAITKAFLSQKISTQLPASFLWLHPRTYCFLDQEAFG